MRSSLVLVLTWTIICCQISDVHPGIKRPSPGWNGLNQPSPQFEATPISILAHVGQNITLPCRVRNLAEQTVSWIRTNELSILTSNIFTFTSDPRFSVEHPDGDSAAWGLKVSGVRLEDAGEYECQVSTLTKLRHTVRLTVKDTSMNSDRFEENILRDSPPSLSDMPDVLLLKPSYEELLVGSISSLTCSLALDDETLASSDEKDLPAIRWKHNGTAINFRNHSKSGSHSRYNLESELSADRLVSRLIISNVEMSDAGVYECEFNDQTAESTVEIIDEAVALAVSAGSPIGCGFMPRCFLYLCSFVYIIFCMTTQRMLIVTAR